MQTSLELGKKKDDEYTEYLAEMAEGMFEMMREKGELI